VATSFIGGGNRCTRRKPPTCGKSLLNKKKKKNPSKTNKQTKKLPSIMIFEMPEMANSSSGRRGRDRTVVVFTTIKDRSVVFSA
jgi:hypothetical protein